MFRGGSCGQATVEAAITLPSVMVVLLLMLEPACLVYTHMVMEGAASEAARAVSTSTGIEDGDEAVRAFVLRRLDAVPEISVFHVGGEQDWQVDFQGAGTSQVTVRITGHARPLPLVGAVASAIGGIDEQGVVLRVQVDETVRPSWLEGSYASWVSIWE